MDTSGTLVDCHCEDYEAGVSDQRLGRTVSPYRLIELHHGSCYRAGQIDERRRTVAESGRRLPTRVERASYFA